MYGTIKMDLWIQGFRSITSMSVSFPIGVSALAGNSGSGKTTLITAMCWILFGSSGTGPHRAVKIQHSSDIVTMGALRLRTSVLNVVVVRVNAGHIIDIPSWVPEYAKIAIKNHASASIYEAMWINDKSVDFSTSREQIFSSHQIFTSTSIVPQKLPSALLTSGKLSQTINDLFFTQTGASCPGTYVVKLKEILDKLRIEIACTEGSRRSSNAHVCDLQRVRIATEAPIVEMMGRNIEDCLKAIDAKLLSVAKTNAIEPTIAALVELSKKEALELQKYDTLLAKIAAAKNAVPDISKDLQAYDEAFAKLPNKDIDIETEYPRAINNNRLLAEREKLISAASGTTSHETRELAIKSINDARTFRDTCARLKVRPDYIAVDVFKILHNNLLAMEDNRRGSICVAAFRTFDSEYATFMKDVSGIISDREKLISEIRISNEIAQRTYRLMHDEWTRKLADNKRLYENHLSATKKINMEKQNAASELVTLKSELDTLGNVGNMRQEGVLKRCPGCSTEVWVSKDYSLHLEGCTPEESRKWKEHVLRKDALVSKIRTLENKLLALIPVAFERPEDPKAPETPKIMDVPASIWTPPKMTEKSIPVVKPELDCSEYIKLLGVRLNDTVAHADLVLFDAIDALKRHEKLHILGPKCDIGIIKNAFEAKISLAASQIAVKKAEEYLKSLGTPSEPTSTQGLSKLINLLGLVDKYSVALAAEKSAIDALEVINGEEAELVRRAGIVTDAIDIVIREKNNYLEKSLTEISNAVNRVLETMFDTGVKYKLQVDDKERLEVVLELGNRNDVDVTALSGGEMDRFSIAVATAFVHFRGSPILIFDETLASLDVDRRRDCVNAISRILSDRVVIFVSHDIGSGIFGNVVDINR
jgi:energy-coupling factor transporter ATP-binding protein EcfA2